MGQSMPGGLRYLGAAVLGSTQALEVLGGLWATWVGSWSRLVVRVCGLTSFGVRSIPYLFCSGVLVESPGVLPGIPLVLTWHCLATARESL